MSDVEKNQIKRVDKPVATGKVRKKSEISKFSDVFLADDVRDVGTYIVSEVIIPTVKTLIYDIGTNGLGMALFGDKAPTRNKRSSRNAEYVSYDKMSRREERYRDEPRTPSRYRYSDISFDSKGEAVEVLEQMDAILENYGMVSVADLYDLADVPGEYTDHKYGWTSLRTADIVRLADGGYMIKLPRAMPLK